LQEKLSKLSEIVHFKEFFADALRSSLEQCIEQKIYFVELRYEIGVFNEDRE
jgi:hypothetical protein